MNPDLVSFWLCEELKIHISAAAEKPEEAAELRQKPGCSAAAAALVEGSIGIEAAPDQEPRAANGPSFPLICHFLW